MDYEIDTPAQHGHDDAYLMLRYSPEPHWTDEQVEEYREAYRLTYIQQFGVDPITF